jgi:ribonuclease HI
MSKIAIYTDGSCRCNTGKGGWGVVIISENSDIIKLSGSEPRTTNNRMELLAAIKALEHIQALGTEYEMTFYTDSTYLSRGMTEWTKGWKKRQWKMCNGQAMKNADLWKQLDALATGHKIKWKWVRSHNGNKYNEMADGLAQEASLPS